VLLATLRPPVVRSSVAASLRQARRTLTIFIYDCSQFIEESDAVNPAGDDDGNWSRRPH
jgi:hypothetical protein